MGAGLYRLKLRLDQVELNADTDTYSKYRLEGVAPCPAGRSRKTEDMAAVSACSLWTGRRFHRRVLMHSSSSYEVYLVDGNHSNSYYGSGPDLEIIERGTGSGDFMTTMDLDVYGVVLVELRQGA